MYKTTILISSILLLTSSFAFAEGHGGKSHAAEVAKKLELTAAQTEQFKSIMKEGKQQIKAIRKQTRESIKAILTPEQQAKMKKLHAERMKSHAPKDHH